MMAVYIAHLVSGKMQGQNLCANGNLIMIMSIMWYMQGHLWKSYQVTNNGAIYNFPDSVSQQPSPKSFPTPYKSMNLL